MQFLLIYDMQEHNCNEFIKLTKRLHKKEEERKMSFSCIDKQLIELQQDVGILHDTLRSVVSVGVDIVPNNMGNDRSWAVICIEGNYNVVKFIDMHGSDYYEILRYLKRFEGSRMCIDAPRGKWFEKEFRWL